MVAQPMEVTRIDKALAAYDVTPAKVAEMVKEYEGLKVIAGDAASYKAVHDARMMIVHTRTAVDKRRLKLGEDARKWVNEVNNAAKQLVAPLIPLEDRLTAEEKAEDNRKAAIKAEAERKEKERVERLRAKIEYIRSFLIDAQTKNAAQIQTIIDNLTSKMVTEEEFQEFAPEAMKAHAETLNVLHQSLIARRTWEQEQAAAKAEAERLAKIRAEQEAQRKALEEAERKVKEAQAKIEADRKALEAAQRAEQEREEREEFERRAREEAKARAGAESKEKVEREAKEAAERAEKEAAEKAREEALRPDKDKIINYITALMKVPVPDIGTESAKVLFEAATTALKKWAKKLIKQAEEL